MLKFLTWVVVACAATTTSVSQSSDTCHLKAADIIILVDSSSSVWGADFKRILTFLKDLLSSFNVAADKIRVGLATFTDRPRVQWALNQNTNKDELMRAMDRVQQTAGDTHTDAALRFLRTKLFSRSYGGRDDVVQIGILITDGKSRSKSLTLKEAFLIHRLTNIQMFAIGIGGDIDKDELIAIASRKQDSGDADHNYYMLSDFYALDYTLKTELAVKACNMRLGESGASSKSRDDHTAGTVWSACSRRTPADVIFATDPHSLGQRMSKKTLRVIRDVISALPVGPQDYRIAFVPQDPCADKSLVINATRVYDTEHGAFGAMSRVGTSRSQLAEYMSAIRTGILSSSHAEESMKRRKIVVVFLDETQNLEELESEAKKLEMNGVVTLAVGVGSKVTFDLLLRIATAADLTFRDTESEQANSKLASDIIRGICVRHYKTNAGA